MEATNDHPPLTETSLDEETAMELIATGQPRAKLDDTGEVIELSVPTGNREKIVFDLTPNQAFALEHLLQNAIIKFFEAQREAKEWRAENVLAFPFDRVRRAS